MAREIWRGPLLSDNRDRLIEICSSRIAHGSAESFLYLAAARPLLDKVTASVLDGQRNAGVWGPLQIYLFKFLVRRIIAEAVLPDGRRLAPRTSIDRDDFPVRQAVVSSLLSHLAEAGKLKAIASLAKHDGCAKTVARLLGEIHRAAISPDEFEQIAWLRAHDASVSTPYESDLTSAETAQLGFDNDVAVVYRQYCECLDRSMLTDDDADQLRALNILRGRIDESEVEVPWLAGVDLLIVDGFYDFTPIQGEILRHLIVRVPNVIVSLNYDDRNPEVFRPFDETIETLQSIASFDVKSARDRAEVQADLAELKIKLFNPEVAVEASEEEIESERYAEGIKIFECGDPTTEVRSIAKEIKRLVVREGYSLTDIAVVLRDRTDYEELIARVFGEQGVPCTLHRSQAATAFPSVKAAVKLLQLIDEMGGSDASEIRMSSLASIIKTGYFNLWTASEASKQNEQTAPVIAPTAAQLSFFESPVAPSPVDRPSIDEMENAIAFVGENLNGAAWLNRAAKLIAGLAAVKRRQNGDSNLSDEEADREESTENGAAGGRVRSLAGITAEMLQASAVAVEQILGSINSTVRLGSLPEVKRSLETLFDRLGYAADVRSRIRQSDTELDRALNDLGGFESLQLAIDATIKSFEIAGDVSQKEAMTVSVSEFARSISSCLNRLYSASHSSVNRGVEVLSATDVRGLRFRVIIIAGLVEGAFPKRVQQDWIYSHEERERLKRYGLKLEDISPNTLLKEEHYFYQAACRATERLYLTRAVVLSDGTETVESYYINEVRHALSPREIRTEKVRPGAIDPAKIGDCSSPTELVLAVTAVTEQNNSNGDQMRASSDTPLAKLNDWLVLQEGRTESVQRRVAAARERSGLGFGRFDGRITNERLKQAIRAKFNGHYVFSASQLGLYGACPFKFFSEKILRFEPRGEAAADLAAMETGRILHEILRRFFEKHRGELLDTSKYESLCGELRGIVDYVFDEHEKHVPPLDPQVWRLNREIRKIELERFLSDELEMHGATAPSGIRPKFFELSFGAKVGRVDPGSVSANLELRREGSSERILVQGRIDRVDQSHDGTTVAYDYKLSSGADRADMEAGRDLQLAIYLEALEQLFFAGRQVAGGGYYSLKPGSGRRNRGLYRREFSTYTDISGRTASNMSDEEWLNLRRVMMDRVWSFWEGMREGRFDIAPTAPTRTCKHCDYSALCRYEQHRVREKLRAASRRLQAGEVDS